MKLFTKEDNNGTNIFVFGSNEGGYHGAGAALTAKLEWGAIQKVGSGIQGMAYGIPTKDKNLNTLPLSIIQVYVDIFKTYVLLHPEKVFLVTRVGCGYAGYSDKEMAPLFKHCPPANCVMPEEWLNFLERPFSDRLP